MAKKKELFTAEQYMKLAIESLINEYNDVKLNPCSDLLVEHVENYPYIDLNGLWEQCIRVSERVKELEKENPFRIEHSILADNIELKYSTVVSLPEWLAWRIEKIKQYLIDEGYLKWKEEEKKRKQAEARKKYKQTPKYKEYMKKYMKEYNARKKSWK